MSDERSNQGDALRARAAGPSDPSPAVSATGGIPIALEFRPDHKGRFDEIVARFADGMVHVETMSNKSCYVGFYWDDGRYCQWWVSSDKKLHYHHEDGTGDPPRFTAQGGEARQGGDAAGGSVHEHPVPAGDAHNQPNAGPHHFSI